MEENFSSNCELSESDTSKSQNIDSRSLRSSTIILKDKKIRNA